MADPGQMIDLAARMLLHVPGNPDTRPVDSSRPTLPVPRAARPERRAAAAEAAARWSGVSKPSGPAPARPLGHLLCLPDAGAPAATVRCMGGADEAIGTWAAASPVVPPPTTHGGDNHQPPRRQSRRAGFDAA